MYWGQKVTIHVRERHTNSYGVPWTVTPRAIKTAVDNPVNGLNSAAGRNGRGPGYISRLSGKNLSGHLPEVFVNMRGLTDNSRKLQFQPSGSGPHGPIWS